MSVNACPSAYAAASMVRTCSRIAAKPPFGYVPVTLTRRSGSGYGSRDSSTPSTRLKTAVLAPLPRASVRTATAVNPGLRRKTLGGVSDVLNDGVDHGHTPRVPAVFPGQVQAAKATDDNPARLAGIHTSGDQVVHLLLDMKTDLVLEVPLHIAATKQRAQPQRDGVAPALEDPVPRVA